MKIDSKKSKKMFEIAGVDREKLFSCLIKMTAKPYNCLKPAAKKSWSPENPTRNYCYVVSEWYLNYKAPKGSIAYSLVVPGDDYKHYFIMHPSKEFGVTGDIVDLTSEQFDDYSLVDYSKGKKAHFMYPSPSKRASILQSFYNE